SMDQVVKALRKLHNLETMAVEIYRVQIGAFSGSEIAEKLVAAMENEQTHIDSFYESLTRSGGKPSPLRHLFWIVGKMAGFAPRLLGKRMILKGDIAFETKAVKDYSKMLQEIPFDDQTRKITEKNLHDEERHIRTWQQSIESL
ncbi:MAG: ferritin-like domain-containing protein, partial [Actinomycetota bacterium]